MILVENMPIKLEKMESISIYINTIAPNFQFKNKYGKLVIPEERCIKQ